ncbi:OmpP1/FadL family transporter [Sulfurirhabdus autotrophica]|uniref:Long-chain fatty acid transport protein n=1 Tax=Sulfurirhabdus autotrophica TaxID=1706046 RepID=A0A4R3Y2U9_9PROT|nr:outer membrane protein transport protein [Sulfurirhabdus autotrophica]TCV85907.1 long-chain fatty acid transport protein [Sulfurirhabdus autotrophica]
MIKSPSPIRKVILFSLASLACGLSYDATASGFALIEDSGSGLGNAFAGGAASAEGASTIYYNPAGLVLLDQQQLVLVAHAIRPTIKFTDQGSSNAPRPVGGNGGDMKDITLVPNFYYAVPVSPALRLGIGINAPFGLKTDYDPAWAGRFQAVKSELKTVNVNPAISYKVNDQLAIGGGINYQHIQAELTSAVNLGVSEGYSTMKGNDYAWGYNMGALFQASPQTRIGASYRSRIRYQLSGDITFTGVPKPNGPVTADLTVPDTLSLSIFHQINPEWDVMADLTWTGWSSFDKLTVVRTTGEVVSSTDENWRNTLRPSIGMNYHYSKNVTLRSGVAFDQSPVRAEYRTARIPDSDRTWLSFGVKFNVSAQGAVDIGYAHIFMKDANINRIETPTPLPSSALKGNYSNSVDILSLQYTHNF